MTGLFRYLEREDLEYSMVVDYPLGSDEELESEEVLYGRFGSVACTFAERLTPLVSGILVYDTASAVLPHIYPQINNIIFYHRGNVIGIADRHVGRPATLPSFELARGGHYRLPLGAGGDAGQTPIDPRVADMHHLSDENERARKKPSGLLGPHVAKSARRGWTWIQEHPADLVRRTIFATILLISTAGALVAWGAVGGLPIGGLMLATAFLVWGSVGMILFAATGDEKIFINPRLSALFILMAIGTYLVAFVSFLE